MISREELIDRVNYNPETGVFTWKRISEWIKNKKASDIAGCINNKVRKITIGSSKYYASQLAFVYMGQEVPKRIEHINGIFDDDRWENLREYIPCKERKILTQKLLKEYLEYNPFTGLFKWAKNYATKGNGEIAGTLDEKGYIRIGIGKKRYRAHRLAFLYMTGEWPSDTVDHINCVKTDNRWDNLRLLSNDENLQNRNRANKGTHSGLLGVHPTRNANKWVATIDVSKKQHYLGTFNCKYEAHQAYLQAKEKLHPASVHNG